MSYQTGLDITKTPYRYISMGYPTLCHYEELTVRSSFLLHEPQDGKDYCRSTCLVF